MSFPVRRILLDDTSLQNGAGYGSLNFEYLQSTEMDHLLQQFYTEVHTKEGNDYSKSTLIGLRTALNHYLTSPPISRNINLMKDRDFMRFNQVLSGLVKQLKEDGI